MYSNWYISKVAVFVLLIATGTWTAESYRILGISPFNGKSHDVVLNAIFQGLANRGHQVDVITHFPPENPPANYRVVANLSGSIQETVNSFSIDFAKSLSGKLTYFIAEKFGNEVCQLMGLEEIQRIVKKPPRDPPYDLVIVHAYGANCYMGFGWLLHVPVVAVSASVEFPWMSHFIGNADNLAASPNIFFGAFDRTDFWQRMKNVYTYYRNLYVFHSLTEKNQTDAMRKYLHPDMPNIREIERSVALTLVNRHPVIYGAKPVTSSLIEVSGLHIEEQPPKLPAELQNWLDASTDGVVYFTFGSMVLIETLPTNTISDIYKSFAKISPVRVLMKVADRQKLPVGLPKNVLTASWVPQQAVLSHKNVRVFLTHGGLMSAQEALHYGVPMIGIPMFCDQHRNVRAFVEKNIAVQINLRNLTSASLDETLNQVLNNPEYRKNAKFYSKLFKDKPMKAMDTAAFWIEYVIRNGAEHLRSPALDLYWWQLALLDVYGFVLFCIISVIILAYCLINFILKICSAKPRQKLKTR